MTTDPQLLAALSLLPPEEAVKYMQDRGMLSQTFSWQDLWQEEHAQQFTVSRLARLDLLQAVYEGVLGSVKGDVSRRDFMRGIQDILVSEGWWGEKEVKDPLTGETLTTKFDPARLKLIFDTNTRMAYSAGLWGRIQRNKATSPYIRYITKRDERVRASHRAWNNLTLPVDHAFWTTHFPPNGWRCRCRAMSMGQAEYDQGGDLTTGKLVKEEPDIQWVDWTNKRTGAVERVPAGIDPGFGYNPGVAAARADAVEKLAAEKLARAGNLMGAAPRALWNRIVSEISPSSIMKMKNLDPNLLEDVGTVKAAEYYIRKVREGILGEIAQGGIAGSAALRHEMTEVAALRKAGLNIYDPADVAKVSAAFEQASRTFDPAAHIPWHLTALMAELAYVQAKLAGLGVQASLGECARAVYGNISGDAEEKMAFELDAIGVSWPSSIRDEIIRAVQA